MKCPKCSYTSFDYLDNCRKCGADLRDVRGLLQVISVSPEERAPVFTREPASQGALGAGAVFAGATSFEDEDLGSRDADREESNDELLADLDFDQSFNDIVMPTSYADSSPEAAPAKVPEEDGLLDLDFGDMFGDKADKDKS